MKGLSAVLRHYVDSRDRLSAILPSLHRGLASLFRACRISWCLTTARRHSAIFLPARG